MEGELAGFASELDIRARERDNKRITPSSLAGATRSTEVLWVKSGRRKDGGRADESVGHVHSEMSN